MILQVYTVHDSKVDAFLPPFFVRARGEALRSFQSACEDSSHQFSKFKADYSLWFVGAFNDQDGTVEAVKPERIIGADQF